MLVVNEETVISALREIRENSLSLLRHDHRTGNKRMSEVPCRTTSEQT